MGSHAPVNKALVWDAAKVRLRIPPEEHTAFASGSNALRSPHENSLQKDKYTPCVFTADMARAASVQEGKERGGVVWVVSRCPCGHLVAMFSFYRRFRAGYFVFTVENVNRL